MKSDLKTIWLFIGLLTLTFSFILFGRYHNAYEMLFFTGIVISFISFAALLSGKQPVISKLVLAGIVCLIAALQFVTAPLLINYSYEIYITTHAEKLAEVNMILENKRGEVEMISNNISDSEGVLNNEERKKLLELRKELNVIGITKTEKYIAYELAHDDGPRGFNYALSNEHKNPAIRHITGRWYR
jgi:hypothetical protein